MRLRESKYCGLFLAGLSGIAFEQAEDLAGHLFREVRPKIGWGLGQLAQDDVMRVIRKRRHDFTFEVGMGVEHLRRLAAGKIDLVEVDRPEALILERFEVEEPVSRINNEAPAGI